MMNNEDKLAYRVVAWLEADGTVSPEQLAIFDTERDAQIYEQIWREEGHSVRVPGSDADYDLPLYSCASNAAILLRRSSRPFTDSPERKGEMVFRAVIRGHFGSVPDESEYNYAGRIYIQGTYIPYDSVQLISPKEADDWAYAIAMQSPKQATGFD